MRAFSLWQPWASLWCSPRKRHETRARKSNFDRSYRGWLAVHATKKFIRNVPSDLAKILTDEFGPHWGLDLPTGAIIGVVNIVDVKATEVVYGRGDPANDDFSCGDFTAGRFAIERREFALLRSPIPYRGQQGRYFDIPDFPALTALTKEPVNLLQAG